MGLANISSLKPSRFTEFFTQVNGLGENQFNKWIFLPGMLFQAPDKWWGNRSKRDRPHEGLDLGYYKDGLGRIRHLNDVTQIPAMYGGTVVKT